MQEEFGIEIEVGNYFCTSSFIHKSVTYDMNMFFVSTFKGELILHEHSAVAWVTVRELSNYAMPEPDLPVVKLLQEREKDLQ
jgi:hypothetical protein